MEAHVSLKQLVAHSVSVQSMLKKLNSSEEIIVKRVYPSSSLTVEQLEVLANHGITAPYLTVVQKALPDGTIDLYIGGMNYCLTEPVHSISLCSTNGNLGVRLISKKGTFYSYMLAGAAQHDREYLTTKVFQTAESKFIVSYEAVQDGLAESHETTFRARAHVLEHDMGTSDAMSQFLELLARPPSDEQVTFGISITGRRYSLEQVFNCLLPAGNSIRSLTKGKPMRLAVIKTIEEVVKEVTVSWLIDLNAGSLSIVGGPLRL